MAKFFLWITLVCVIASGWAAESQISSYFAQHHTHHITQLRFYTYLYSAQCQSSSPDVHSCIEERLMHRFFPDYQDTSNACTDFYVRMTADQILCPLLARLRAEECSAPSFDSSCWPDQVPDYIMQTAKWIPWSPPLPQPPPPLAPSDHEGWKNQFHILEEIRASLTEQQRAVITAHKKDVWNTRADAYLQNVPIEKSLFIRSLLSKALYDGTIAEMRYKYAYCIPRPFMLDPNFKSLIPMENTPTYPSGHAIRGTIFATIFCHFFPEDSTQWNEQIHHAKLIRMQEGVHFPEDVEQGSILGKKIATQTLKRAL